MRFVLLAILVTSCGGAATQTSAQPLPQTQAPKTYAIHMHRDSHVGGRSHVVLDGSDDTTTVTTKDGAELDRKHTLKKVHFDGIGSILAIDGSGDATRLHYDVTDLVTNDKSIFRGPVDLTRALKESDAVILINGAPAVGEVHDALASVLSLRVGGPKDDEIFGTSQPQPVGAHWPINGKRAVEDLANDPKLRASSITGESTLAGVTDCCIDLRSTMHMSGMTLPGAPTSGVDGAADGTFEAIFPMDAKRDRVEDHMVFHIVMKVVVPTPKGAVNVDVDVTSRKDGHFTDAM
jgi:hypothetical protein